MVATVRKPAHTRFLLRSKDSALFRAMEEGFFDKSGADNNNVSQKKLDVWNNKTDAWKSTINSQVYHDNNDDTTWDDPQRTRQQMLEQAISVLLSSSSANGLFPGKLDQLQEPTLYDSERMRDTYWGNTFEIPYVLWKYCFDLEHRAEVDGDHGSGSPQNLSLKDDDLSPSHIVSQVRTLLNQGMELKRAEHPNSPSMRRSLPFNNIVDAKNIVELQDEWLYSMPEFFVPSTEGEAEVNTADEANGDAPESLYSAGTDSQRSIHSGRASSSGVEKPWCVFDFRKSKSLKERKFQEKISSPDIETEADVKRWVAKGRTPDDAKKRWWMFHSLHPSENIVCLSTVSRGEKREKKALYSFFSRHESFNNYFREDIVAELNTWETELHLSFHTCFLDGAEDSWETKSHGRGKEIVFPPLIDGEKPFCVTNVAMSFRFEGDVFDRYWTCRQLSADPEGRYASALDDDQDSSEEEISDNVSGCYEAKDDVWAPGLDVTKQRKCLELGLFNCTLQLMNASADEIMTKMTELLESGKDNLRKSFEATQGVGKSLGTDAREMLDYKGFLVASKRFQEFQSCMRRVEGQVTENLATIDAWINRERQREAERPRWSFNHESRYRAHIIKTEANNYGRIQALKIYHGKVLNLIETTTKDLELMRSYLDIMQSDLDLRRSEDIKRFTYVTVVFLPLGFATGIFSTSGSPAGTTLVHMTLTAIATLTTTVIALMAYKFADSPRSRDEF
ncbi:mg2+ transporter zinc transport protein [Colletotrichum asianum]